jgi:hypothetical protein
LKFSPPQQSTLSVACSVIAGSPALCRQPPSSLAAAAQASLGKNPAICCQNLHNINDVNDVNM